MRKHECSFLVPIVEDERVGNGQAHPAMRWFWLQDRLEELFGGWTIAPGRYHGLWLDEAGDVCIDRSRKYIVDADTGQRPSLIGLVATVAARFRQRVVRLVIGSEVLYVPRDV